MQKAIEAIKYSLDPTEENKLLVSTLDELSMGGDVSLDVCRHCFEMLDNIESSRDRRLILLEMVQAMPSEGEFLPLYMNTVKLAIDAVNDLEDPKFRKDTLRQIARRLPEGPEFYTLYKHAIEIAIDASKIIGKALVRKHSLVEIAIEVPKSEEFEYLSLRAFALALDLSDDPDYKRYSLAETAEELPKTCDYAFYRKSTLLGIAGRLPKTGKYLELYKDAIKLAINAANVLDESYYRKYSLIFIANSLPKTEEFFPLYAQAMADALDAAISSKDHIVRKFALVEFLKEVPKEPVFYSLILMAVEKILPSFDVKSWMEDVDVLDVIDYVIVAEEQKMKETKKNRYARGRFARLFIKQLDSLGPGFNDIRFIEVLKPYDHVWVRPKELRSSITRIIDQLETLKEKYHGKELERPVFVKESYPASEKASSANDKEALIQDSISIDLGATNTVIMKRRGDAQPDFVSLETISRQYGDVQIVPTLLSQERKSIGMEALVKNPIIDLKRMLLDGEPNGKIFMEKYFQILYQHLKRVIAPSGWFPIISSKLTDKLYLTVPVGFHSYRKTMEGIIKKTMKGVEIEFIEEPLAAAIGYQVAEVRDKVIMIIDFGGCTLDIMLLRISINDIHVIAKPDRSRVLGGRDVDIWLAEHLAKEVGISSDKLSADLIINAEGVKIALSDHELTPFDWEDREICKVSRDDLEEILASHDFYKMVDRSVSYVLQNARKVGVSKGVIEAVLLTGGSSQIPSFKEKIGHTFPELRKRNAIYDHSPLAAVARGAALYSTRDVIDRHLGIAYALRYATKGKDANYAYEIVFEKGDSLPLERTFNITKANTLGSQNEVYLELFEVTESLIGRRWIMEGETEFIRQVMKQNNVTDLKGFKVINIPVEEPATDMTFCLSETGRLTITYGKEEKKVNTDLILQ